MLLYSITTLEILYSHVLFFSACMNTEANALNIKLIVKKFMLDYL
jgi:hypothetical protein